MADQNANNKDAIVWRLEQGAVLRANGQYEASNKAFDQAQEKIDDYAQKAKVRLGQEAGALLSNQANLDYEGRAYDGIMLNTYKALNYLALGEPDKARAGTHPRLPAPAGRRRGQSESASKKSRLKPPRTRTSATIDKAQNDPKLQVPNAEHRTPISTISNPMPTYVNPFTVYLDGLYFMANAADGSDLERARKSFERVVGFAPDNDYVKQDLATVDDLMNGKPLAPTTYIIFETGCAPVRGQIRIDIPIIVAKVSYIGAAFPTLKPQGNYIPSLTVTANGTNADHVAGCQHGQRHRPGFQK